VHFFFYSSATQLSEHERDRKRRCRSAREEWAELVSFELPVCSFPRYRATTCNSVCRRVRKSRKVACSEGGRDVIGV